MKRCIKYNMCDMYTLWRYSIFVALFVTKKHVSADISEDLVVVTDLGSYRGLRADDGNYTMFMGIPYAKVNESNVFGDSIPQEPFEGVFEAYNDSAMCPQNEKFNYTTVGSLDCLHLNVYVPDTDSSENPLPVMVYIYGGAFKNGFAGRSLYGPKYLVRHDVILVTLNYRMGPYGFMCLDTPEIPGNSGLKDQVLALRWIQRNIKSFGGDPDKVTLFGNSSGGMCTALHLISETEKLFSNIISQSGPISTFGPNQFTTAPLVLAAELGYETDDVDDAITFLNSADVHRVIDASLASGLSFKPCLEKKFLGVDRFLAENGIYSHYSKAPGVTVMLGFTSHELLRSFPGNEGPSDWLIWNSMFENNFKSGFTFDETLRSELSDLSRRFYLGDEEINNDVKEQVMDHQSDTLFAYPIIRLIKKYIEAGVEKVYQYRFSYDGDRNYMKRKQNITLPGATHGDEISYLFLMKFIRGEPSENDQLIIDRVTTMWTNFAKYRDPTPETNELLPVKWEPITTGSPYHYINIDTEMSAHRGYEPRRMTFWDLFYQAYAKYEVGYVSNETEEDSEDALPDSSTVFTLHPLILFIIVVVNVLTSIKTESVLDMV